MMNEYVHPNHLLHNQGVWTVEYEPLERLPIIQGSLFGAIYDGLLPRGFEAIEDDRIIGPVHGVLLKDEGIIVLCYYSKPSSENFLRVSYEAGYAEVIDNCWLLEGF